MVTVGPVVMYENDECEIPIEIPQETPAIKAIKSSLL
jgi:hypothetical protein